MPVADAQIRDEIKDQTRLLGDLIRWLDANPEKQDRRRDCIHPSELSHSDFCQRAAYYALKGIVPRAESHSFALRNVFQEGHDIGDKWQNYFWRQGVLSGMFECLVCRVAGREATWWATSPTECKFCRAPRIVLRYREVPLASPEHLISGSADGQVGDILIEIKSIGEGTLRLERPLLYEQFTHRCNDRSIVDLRGMWKAVTRPFKTHINQGQLYLHCTGLKGIVFIYECKWNQQVKEFYVPYSASRVEPLLEICRDVRYALEKNAPPYCRGCASCRAYPQSTGGGADVSNDEGPAKTPRRRLHIPGSAPVFDAEDQPAAAADGPGGGTDGAVRGTGGMDRPRQWHAGPPRGRRTKL